jgi:CheY-like chemotaxis protein
VASGQKAGWELLERLNADASTEQIPVLVVSTDPALLVRAEEQANRYGGSRFLNKPFNLEAVLEAVHELIGPA